MDPAILDYMILEYSDELPGGKEMAGLNMLQEETRKMPYPESNHELVWTNTI